MNNSSSNVVVVVSTNIILDFSLTYSRFHGWLSLVICLFGIPFNLFIILVLLRTKIASFAINLILISIAVSDSITMLVYVPYCFHFYVRHSNSYLVEPFPSRDTHFWTVYSLINIFVSITFHSISIWLTVYLAFYRYFYIRNSVLRIGKQTASKKETTAKNNRFVEFLLKKSKSSVSLIFLFCVAYCSPTYFYPTIRADFKKNSTNDSHNLIYYVDESQLNRYTHGWIFAASLYGQALFTRVVPCILVVTFISLLIHLLLIVERNKRSLIPDKKKTAMNIAMASLVPMRGTLFVEERDFTELSPIASQTIYPQRRSNNRQPAETSSDTTNHTNVMLIVVCILFLVSEFPHTVLLLVSIFNASFYNYVYKPLGDLMDILVLINQSINFLLYCSMSQEFRRQVTSFFKS